MARKQPPKPLFEVKGDFYESLDNFTNAVIFLNQQVRSALELGCIDARAADLIKKRLDALDAAMSPSAQEDPT